jgi:hypothetical protein
MQPTFVSALIDLDEDRPVDKSTERYIGLFNLLQTSGIRFHLFLSPKFRGHVQVHNGIIEYLTLKDLETVRAAPEGLPAYRNVLHDTRNFLVLMNAKTELVRRAMDSQMHSSTHFAWIDFGICHMFRTPHLTLNTLRDLSGLPSTCLYLPGCWDRLESVALAHVVWRFCGSFFVGDAASCRDFADRVLAVLPTLPHLTWEVNVWAHLETLGWTPTWYKADHNDSILDIPTTSGLVRVPPGVPLYWRGGYSECNVGSVLEQYTTQSVRRYPGVSLFRRYLLVFNPAPLFWHPKNGAHGNDGRLKQGFSTPPSVVFVDDGVGRVPVVLNVCVAVDGPDRRQAVVETHGLRRGVLTWAQHHAATPEARRFAGLPRLACHDR